MSGRRSRFRLSSGIGVCLAMPAALVASLALTAPGPASPCPDADSDGYADCLVPGCTPDGQLCGDCNDASPLIHPDATEVCNHLADACGGVDEGFPQVTSMEHVVDGHGAAGDRFGVAAISLGDVSGDGVPDFAVGNPWDDLGATDGGSVTLYSGADRAVLCRRPMANAFAHLGTTLAVAGDLNGDGLPDLAAGAPGLDFILLISGAGCGEIGRCFDPTGEANILGGDHGLAAVDDITGDGLPELIAGGTLTNVPLHHGGKAIVFSPAPDGACGVLFTLSDPDLTIYANLGFAAAGLEDASGDGVADIAVGEPGDDHRAASAGSVLIFSGADGSLLARRLDPLGATNNRFGESVAVIPDLNGDLVGDLVVGAPRRTTSVGTQSGEIIVLSGADGGVLMRLHDPDGEGGDQFGAVLAVLPDVDGDRVPDIVVGARYADRPGANDAGRAIVFSGADGSRIRTLDDPAGSAGDQLG